MKVEELKWSFRELLTVLEPKAISDLELTYNELEKKIEGKALRKVVDQKLKEHGFYKSIDLAYFLGVSRQEVSQMLKRKKADKKYETIEFGGCKYVKAIEYKDEKQ